jgi:hypothetical protein
MDEELGEEQDALPTQKSSSKSSDPKDVAGWTYVSKRKMERMVRYGQWNEEAAMDRALDLEDDEEEWSSCDELEDADLDEAFMQSVPVDRSLYKNQQGDDVDGFVTFPTAPEPRKAKREKTALEEAILGELASVDPLATTTTAEMMDTNRKRKRTAHRAARKRGVVRLRRECFACAWQDHGEGVEGVVSTIEKMIHENLGLRDTQTIARQVHLYFKNHVYLPRRRNGIRIAIWRTADVLEHIMRHTYDPRLFLMQSMDQARSWKRILEDMAFRKQRLVNGRVRYVAEANNIKLALSIDKHMLDLYKNNPRTLNFYNDRIGIDMERIAKLVNMSNNFRTVPLPKTT